MRKQTDKPRGWTRAVLFVSLALNLVVAGIVVGGLVSDGPRHPGNRFDLTVGPLTRAMDEEHRSAVRQALRNSDVLSARGRQAVRADYAQLLETLRAETFEPEAFRAAVSRQRTRLQEAQDAVLAVVGAQIAEMTPPERQAFADRLEEQMRRAPPRRNEP